MVNAFVNTLTVSRRTRTNDCLIGGGVGIYKDGRAGSVRLHDYEWKSGRDNTQTSRVEISKGGGGSERGAGVGKGSRTFHNVQNYPPPPPAGPTHSNHGVKYILQLLYNRILNYTITFKFRQD